MKFDNIFCKLLLIIISPYLLFAKVDSSAQKIYEVNVSKNLLGTAIEAKVLSEDIKNAKAALLKAFKEIERIDSVYNMYRKGSPIYLINLNAGINSQNVPLETYRLIKRAIEYSKKYEQLFDITIGPLTNLWGFNSDKEIIIPSQSSLDSLLKLVNYRNIILEEKDTSVYLIKKGMMLDLGGIAKGFAVDRASAILKESGIKDFLINAGGDICVSGKNDKNDIWTIGIKHPRKQKELLASFKTTNTCIATSGDYERFTEIKGIRYHHILYPNTGMPGWNNRSVTVMYKTTEEATVLAKYIFLIGNEQFKKLKLEKEIKYFTVDEEGKINYNKSLLRKNSLKIIDK
ncbi:MAG: FAD:protein FMN transferase [Ignavibacteriae bacterium]|nr:FAD:protein FMN transferase [Ignavibacteriota bacterium]